MIQQLIAAPLVAAGSNNTKYADFHVPLWAWALLIGVLSALLIADLLLVHRTAHDITLKEAGIESAIWITIGLSFTFVMLGWHGGQAAGEYLSGYLIEKSLSIDNVFVWAVIFSYFGVPKKYQFRVLFWGIFGALILRAIFIFAGVSLINRFDWILYVFGAFLVITAVRVARHKEGEVHPEKNPVLKLVRRLVPSTDDYDGQKMFTRRTGRRLATPLFAVLILVETTDVVFAVDSIPAILSISHQTFIVFSSNAFAILGLRSLYFLLAGVQGKFRYLNYGLGVILGFVGVKMLIADLWHMPTWLSLVVITVVLTVTILASLWADKHHPESLEPTDEAAIDGEIARGEIDPVNDMSASDD